LLQFGAVDPDAAFPDTHSGQLKNAMAKQQEEAQERQRIEQELRVARLIEQTLLPKTLPGLPGYDVAAYYQPAREVGGDFYDFLQLPDGRLGLIVGDVSGKGVPAAIVGDHPHDAACRLPSGLAGRDPGTGH
jgi:serine phosphatase RsbU (regulator of sigma subunit)